MIDKPPADVIGAPLAAAPRRGAAVAFIFVTILLDMLAVGVIIPILPRLVESFVDNDTANAARIFGLFGTAWAAMQFFFSPILGGLSDRFGRRPVVLLSNLGLALDYGPFLFTLTFAYFISAQAPLKLPGAPFLLASALVLLALVVAARTLAGMRDRRSSVPCRPHPNPPPQAGEGVSLRRVADGRDQPMEKD